MAAREAGANAPKAPGLGARLALFFAGLATIRSILMAKLWSFRARPGPDRVAVLVTRSDIEPANHGAAVRIQQLAAGLSRRLDAVFVVTGERGYCLEWRDGRVSRRRFPAWLRWLGPQRHWVILKLLLRGFPLSNLFLYFPLADAGYTRRALWLGRRYRVVLWQAEFPAYAVACLRGQAVFGGATVLAEHNVEYERIREQEPDLGERRYALLRYWELRLCRASDNVICVSEPDRERLVADGVPAGRITVIPHGVDLASFREAKPADLRARYGLPRDCRVLVYHGTYRYPPNLEAMEFLARDILPALRRDGTDYRVLAVGLYPPARSPSPDILFTGAVEDLAAVLKGADAALVPLRQGGGTRMKVLDYLAAGIPVVSTAKGVEGLPLEAGRHYLAAETAGEFAAALAELSGDPARAEALVSAGRAFAESLDWQVIADRNLKLASSE